MEVLTERILLFSNCISCLLSSTNEQYNCIVSCRITHEVVCLVSVFYSLLQVDNVDSVTRCLKESCFMPRQLENT